MTAINREKYPHYTVEGRRFDSKDAHLAVHFARDMANRMGRPVHIMRTLDSWTPDAVVYTAEPEKD